MLGSVEASAPFADTVARAWLASCGNDPVRSGDGLILVPTRRATRTLADAFMRAAPGPALLLPRINAIGDAEAATRAPIASGLAPLAPSIEPTLRLALLSRLVLARGGRDGAPRTLDRAWPLAVELARLLDEAAREGVALGDALRTLAPAALAAHWEITLDFLRIVTEAWPAILAERGVLDPAERQARLLRDLAAHWTASPSPVPVWLAGVNAATGPEAALARAIASMPDGRVLLPGLDLAIDEEDWEAIGPVHPQAGLKQLLGRIGVRRDEVAPVAAPGEARAGRVALLRRALLPAQAVARRWREDAAGLDIAGVSLLVASDEQEEAVAIALALRDAIEDGRTEASLVTPDRLLARRVVAELARFGVVADDSAGEALAETPPAVLVRLVATVLAEGWAPATLLALLRHPLAAFGTDRASCRLAARALELGALRGPRLPPGPDAIRRALGSGARTVRARTLLGRIEVALSPLAALVAAERVPPSRLLDGLIEAAERVAATDDEPGSATLWAGVEGDALAAHLASLRDAVHGFDPEPPLILPSLLEGSMVGIAVHGAPSLRGRQARTLHDRVTIRGLLEARGQGPDFLVLGGLVETVWPGIADTGPWMGRTMRSEVGLPSPEERLGAEAHDFAMLVASADRVVLSRSERRDRAPTVASRWLARIEACLHGTGLALPLHPAVGWARRLDRPAGPPVPVAPPSPRPPLHARPRKLSVTAIEIWQQDPYAIHARYVLGIRPLPDLEEDEDHALFGTVVHAGLADALGAGMRDADAIERALGRALDLRSVRPGLAAWWRPRLSRIAAFVAEREAEAGGTSLVVVEREGTVVLEGPGGAFTLTGRADRIERGGDGAVTILDYKTGTPPTRAEVREGWASQLPLEAAMARLGGFGDEFGGRGTAALVHWKLSGGVLPGKVASLVGEEAATAADAAWDGLRALIAAYDDPDTPYLAQPHPGRVPRFPRFAALARVGEWRLASGGDDGEGAGG